MKLWLENYTELPRIVNLVANLDQHYFQCINSIFVLIARSEAWYQIQGVFIFVAHGRVKNMPCRLQIWDKAAIGDPFKRL